MTSAPRLSGSHGRRKLPFQDVQRARVVLYAAEGVLEARDSSIDRTGLDSCSSMRCGSELGEDVLSTTPVSDARSPCRGHV